MVKENADKMKLYGVWINRLRDGSKRRAWKNTSRDWTTDVTTKTEGGARVAQPAARLAPAQARTEPQPPESDTIRSQREER